MKGESFTECKTVFTGMEGLTANFATWIELIKTAMGLFSEFPLNLLLVGSLFGVAFSIFRRAKKSAKA